MPAPETIGLTLNTQFAATVKDVAADSAAAKAGIRAGDEIVCFNGAPLLSIADFAWALHRMPDTGEATLQVRRSGTATEIKIPLASGWRTQSDISTRVGTWQMRGMATGGLKLQSAAAAKRESLGISPGTMALEVAFVGQYGMHGAAKKAGFQQGDVLVEVDGFSADVTEGQLLGRLLTKYAPKTSLKTIVRRGSERVELMLPVQ
jgi:serine protease Do